MRALEEIRAAATPEEAVSLAASLQNGGIRRDQMRVLGLSDQEIDGRVDHHLLHRVFHAVYLVGHTARNDLTLPTAALLAAAHDDAALSHYTAAGLDGIRRMPPNIVDVTVPGARRKSRKGLRYHSDLITPDDIRRYEGLQMTTTARTVADLSRLVPRDETRRLVDQALIQGKASVDELLAVATPFIAGLLDVPHDIAAARSRAEAKLMRMLHRAGLPIPRQNVRVAGYECDLVWELERLIAEYDPWLYHHTPGRFTADRAKNNAVQRAGFAIFRYTDEILTRPERFLAELAVELAKRTPAAA